MYPNRRHPSVLGHLERDFDVGLSTEVIDFRRLDLGDDVDQVGGVGKITVVEDHVGSLMLVLVEVLQSTSVE